MSDGKTFTPYDIELILWIWTRPEPRHDFKSEHYAERVQHFLNKGLIKDSVTKHNYELTDRGAALVEFWCRTPLPVAVWTDPRFSK